MKSFSVYKIVKSALVLFIVLVYLAIPFKHYIFYSVHVFSHLSTHTSFYHQHEHNHFHSDIHHHSHTHHTHKFMDALMDAINDAETNHSIPAEILKLDIRAVPVKTLFITCSLFTTIKKNKLLTASHLHSIPDLDVPTPPPQLVFS